MKIEDHEARYCIIGAGSAGLAAAKSLKEFGIPYDCIEREDDVGGNWYYGKPNSSIYRSVHTITSKAFTEYPGFPLPAHYPTYIGYPQALEYLRSFARAFDLYEHIQLGRTVERIAPVDEGRRWDVTLDGGEARRYRGVIVCNGHLWDPRRPRYPGHFDGLTLHSSEYKTPEVLRGKRVLVVGAGNSGCDIAVEASHDAARTLHSTRRGYYYWPKFLYGRPADEWAEIPLKLRMPLFARRLFGKLVLRWFSTGDPAQYGLPKPDHKMFEAHFIINSQLMYHLAHGDIGAKPDIAELRGDRVLFTDGTEEPIDVIVYATGFNLKFPFIAAEHLDWAGTCPDLYMKIFHRRYDNLFMVGLFQTSTGNWPLMDYQARLMARFIHAERARPKARARFLERKASERPNLNGGIRFQGSERHAIECEHFSYRAKLRKLIAGFDLAPPHPLLPGASAPAPDAGAGPRSLGPLGQVPPGGAGGHHAVEPARRAPS
jgi:cation diffusion facilitator CzcD-associated flavoprotein CzcO